MNENILKNKKLWLCVIITALSFAGISFHLKIKKKSSALAALKKASNLTLSQVPPKWISHLPQFAVQYLEPTFPIQADYTLEETLSLIDIPKDKDKKALSLSKSCRLLNELGNVSILNVDCSRQPEIDHLEYIDSLLSIDSLQELKIIGDRLKIKKSHGLKKLTKLSIECTDISSSIFDILSKSSYLQKLTIRTKAFITSEDLKKLSHLKQMSLLDLDGLKCNEDALQFIQKMTKLETLNLSSYKQQIVSSWEEGGLKLPGGFKIDKALKYLSKHKNLKKISAIVDLNKENLELLIKNRLHPTAYYRFPKVIDDSYIAKLGKFLDMFPADQESIVKGMMRIINLKGQTKLTDKSLAFLKKYKPPYLDLRGTSITKIRELPLDSCISFRLPENSNISDAIPNITKKEYDEIDIRGSKINDYELSQILKQARPKVFYMDGKGLTAKSIDNAMDYFNERPKDISKISFGNWNISGSRRLEFLDRVHQWGMSVVYSSHLTPDLILTNWHLHKTKTVVHDKVGQLLDMEKIFPSLKTLILKGLPLSSEEWTALHKLKSFDSLYLESPNNGEALNKSGILRKIENFDIKSSMFSPVKLNSNISKCRVFLQNGEPLRNIIDLSEGAPESLIIDGVGSINFKVFKNTVNLKYLAIGPDIKVTGEIENIPDLESIKCLSEMNEETLLSAKNLRKVKVLLLNCEKLTSEIFKEWASIASIEVLDLSAANLNDKDFEGIGALKALRVLNLPAHEGITSKFLSFIEANDKLHKLNIIGTSIVTEDLESRYSMPGHWDFEL